MPVPSGATTGNVVVTVGGVASNGVSFTVTAAAPSISSLSPTSGAVGTAVTITGTNFGATQGTSTVTFNGTAATPTSLECDEHYGAGTERGDDGECGGDGRRGGEQRSELHGDRGGTEHQQSESDVRGSGDGSNDHGHELWSDTGHEHGDVQRHGRDTDGLEWDEHNGAGTERGDDGECGGDGRRGGEQRSELHGDRGGTEHQQSESDVRVGGDGSNDHGHELWSDTGHEHGEIQRHGRDTDGLEWDEHNGAGTERGDDGECGGDGRRGGEQWSELHGDRGGTEHQQSESDVRVGGDGSNDHGHELWSDTGHEHGEIQRDGRDTDGLEWDEHNGAGTERGDDGECGGDGRRGGEQWSELHGDRGGTEHQQSESDVRVSGDGSNDHGHELWSDTGHEHGEIQRGGRDTDGLEWDEHNGAGTERGDDGECGGDGRRSGEQRSELHGDHGWIDYRHHQSQARRTHGHTKSLRDGHHQRHCRRNLDGQWRQSLCRQ